MDSTSSVVNMETVPDTQQSCASSKNSKEDSDAVSSTCMTMQKPVTNRDEGKTEERLRFPPSQSPLMTLLQKNREGVFPKGAVYIGSTASEESDKILSEVMDYLEKETSSISGSSTSVKPSQESSTQSRSVFTSQVNSEVPVSVRRQLYEPVSIMIGNLSKSKSPEKHQPKKIEDYEPGHSSIALLEPSEDEDYNPPIVKPGELCHYTESDSEFEYHIHKNGKSMLPSQSETSVHELYRNVLKGGQIPQEGLRHQSPETKRACSVPTTTSQNHHRLCHTVSDSKVIVHSRQQRDQLNALRKIELNRIIAEQKRKKMEEELRKNQARRHSDFLMPSQKSPVPLNRYEENDNDENVRMRLTLPQKKFGSKIRGKARALYNFKAQNGRELSFRKGDILFLLRQIDKNWFEGERHGVRGRFPVSYVEVLLSLDVAHAVAAESEGLARVLYNFMAQSSFELNVKKGDLVKVIRRVDDNWYEGRLGNQRGIFPVRYVEILMEPNTPLITPMSSRTVTPMIGSPGTLSPTSSIFSFGPAPTIPSAPLSPVDSEMDESKSIAELWWLNPSCWSMNAQPAIAASRHYHERSRSTTPSRALYYSTGGLDELHSSAPAQPCRPLSRSSSAGPPGEKQLYYGKEAMLPQNGKGDLELLDGSKLNSFACNVKSLTNSYHFETGTNQDPAWNQSSSLKNQREERAEPSSNYSHLRYPPHRSCFKYVPRNGDELELNVGDIVYVVEKCDDGWYVGFSERTKDFGTFPGNYVVQLW